MQLIKENKNNYINLRDTTANISSELLIIGDVHGKIDEYYKLIKKHKGLSIQIGDFGFKKEHNWHLKNIDFTQHKICFGNHDDYSFFHKPHSLNNFSVWDQKLMTIRGAKSIDKHLRTENINWWANEEMSMEEMQQTVDHYILNKPKIIVSHDCPNVVRKQLFGINEKSITTNGMQVMFDNYKPDLWIFGHHHKSINEVIEGTRFICLAELNTILL